MALTTPNYNRLIRVSVSLLACAGVPRGPVSFIFVSQAPSTETDMLAEMTQSSSSKQAESYGVPQSHFSPPNARAWSMSRPGELRQLQEGHN